MISFKKALDQVEEGEKPSALLANGFSQAWNHDIFNYQNLLAAASFDSRDAEIRGLFARFDTYDFEAVMRALVSAREVVDQYGGNEGLVKQIESDQELLKDALISAISNTHPDLPAKITDAQFTSARLFLSKFRQIFTLNYDLLMYWARNKPNLDPENYSSDDGFRKHQLWKGIGTNQQVHFLHGGLHIYDSGFDIAKHACTNDGVSIIEQVRENLNYGKFPLFVSEPSHEKKKSRIERHPYLSYCYQALRDLTGSLFIHGHSFDENDKHIFDQLRKSKLSKVFVSIYGDENSEENRRTKANALAYLGRPGLEVVFYDASTAPIWA